MQPRAAAKAAVWLYWHKADRPNHQYQWSCHWKAEVLEKEKKLIERSAIGKIKQQKGLNR